MRFILILSLAAICIYGVGCATENERSLITCREPVRLEKLYVYRDGGSLGFVLACADESKLKFCIDGGINSPTKGYFFLDVTHAIQEERIKLPMGGVEERRLLFLLNSWLKTNFTSEELDMIVQSTDFRNMTEKEFRAWHIKHLIDGRGKYLEGRNRF